MRIVISFILLFFFDKLQAQDTLYFGSEGLKRSWKINPTGYLLEDKIIKDTGVFSFVENVTNSLPKLSRKCIKDTCILPNHMLLSRCSFSNLKTYYTKLYFSTANVFNFKSDFTFTVEHSNLKGDIGVSGMYMDTSRPFALNYDTLQAAHFIYCNGWFNIGQSVITERISFDHCRLSDLQVDQNDFSTQDTAQISVRNSVINRFGASGNNAKNVKFLFANDSLFRDFSVFRVDHENVKKDSGGVFVFIFENCFLNCDLNISESSKQVTVRFLNCSFGKDFNLNHLYIDSLEFDNCTKFQETIDLNRIASEHLFISFINTDLKNFRFNYLGRFNLYFPNGTSDEFRVSTFENLLAKFKLEGKLTSYKNIDIEYTQYAYNKQGVWGRLVNLIDNIWWFYGYRKYYVLYWTFGFLLLFYFLNLRWWKFMQEVYPIIPLEQSSFHYRFHRKHKGIRYYVNIFVFTAYIFFSLRVDFGKLSYRNSRMLSYFFIQYLIGLICVFFIANAILKIA